jgi:hypothetical protein
MPSHQSILPIPLTTNEPASFAAFSLEKRLPTILGKLIDDAVMPAKFALQQLAAEMQTGKISALPPVVFGALDQTIQPYIGRSWANMPFLTVELYFYARILLAFGYTAITPVDPFQSAKETANDQAVKALSTLVDYCDPDYDISKLLHQSVLGNTADLSQHNSPTADQVMLLVDESDTAVKLIVSGMQRIDWVLDNAGMDVLTDLLLIRRISQYCSHIVVHVRPYPMFISDITLADMKRLLEKLCASSILVARQLGQDIMQLLHQNKLILRVSPALGLSANLYENKTLAGETFGNAELVIFKGDLNYRYFAGDQRWPHTMEKHYFLQHFGRSALFLRTVKSEVLAGLTPEIAEQTSTLQSDWLTCGCYGIIQVFNQQLKRIKQ